MEFDTKFTVTKKGSTAILRRSFYRTRGDYLQGTDFCPCIG